MKALLHISVLLVVSLITGQASAKDLGNEPWNSATLSGHIDNINGQPFVVEITTGIGRIYNYVDVKTYSSKTDGQGHFSFIIPMETDPVKINILFKSEGKTVAFTSYYLEPADRVYLNVTADRIPVFSGLGAEKFRYTYAIHNLIDKLRQKYSREPPVSFNSGESVRNHFSRIENVALLQRNILKTYEQELSPIMKTLFEADIKGDEMVAKYSSLRTAYFKLPEDREIARIIDHLDSLPLDTTQASIKSLSASYTDFLILKARTGLSFKTGERKNSLNEVYKKIQSDYKGPLMEKALVRFLVSNSISEQSNDYEWCLRDALSITQSPFYKAVLEEQLNVLAKNALAYDFSLPDTSGKKVTMADFKGKAVLLDFWFTGCMPCLKLAGSLHHDVMPVFNDQDVAFVSINLDENEKRWKQSVKAGKYAAPGAVHLFTEGLAFNHPLIKHYNIQGCPYLLLVDKNGRIFSATPPRDSRQLIEVINGMLARQN